jgi:phosphoglycolate phosphatase
MKFGTLLIDLDGVLLDSHSSLVRSYLTACLEHGVIPDQHRFSSLLGGALEPILQALHPDAECHALAVSFKAASLADPPLAFDSAGRLLDGLRRIGVRVVVVTNKDEVRARSALSHNGLSVDDLISPSMGFAPKPDGAMLAFAIQDLRIEDCLYVGDTEIDQLAARNVGIRYGHAKWGYQPDLHLLESEIGLSTMSEILECFTSV